MERIKILHGAFRVGKMLIRDNLSGTSDFTPMTISSSQLVLILSLVSGLLIKISSNVVVMKALFKLQNQLLPDLKSPVLEKN